MFGQGKKARKRGKANRENLVYLAEKLPLRPPSGSVPEWQTTQLSYGWGFYYFC